MPPKPNSIIAWTKSASSLVNNTGRSYTSRHDLWIIVSLHVTDQWLRSRHSHEVVNAHMLLEKYSWSVFTDPTVINVSRIFVTVASILIVQRQPMSWNVGLDCTVHTEGQSLIQVVHMRTTLFENLSWKWAQKSQTGSSLETRPSKIEKEVNWLGWKCTPRPVCRCTSDWLLISILMCVYWKY